MWPVPDYVTLSSTHGPSPGWRGLDMLHEAGEDAVNWLESTTAPAALAK